MQQHVTILSWIYIIFGVLGILGGFGLLFVMLGAGALAHDRQALLATGIIGFVIAGVLVVLSLPSLLAGWGLTKRREWARILAIILGVIHLLAFPVGTSNRRLHVVGASQRSGQGAFRVTGRFSTSEGRSRCTCRSAV